MTPSKEEALLPCPFCGTVEHLSVASVGSLTADMPDRPYRVVCTHIGHDTVTGPVAYGKRAAIAAWNTRAALPPQHSSGDADEDLRAAKQLAEDCVEHQLAWTDDRVSLALAAIRYGRQAALSRQDRPEGACQSCGESDGFSCNNCGAALASRSAPDGWVLVPRELTSQMIQAAWSVPQTACDPFPRQWQAALAASPSALSGEGGE